jgi:hypothetical protein
MTVEEEIEDFIKFFGIENLPNPEHEPRRFAYYVRLYRYYKSR